MIDTMTKSKPLSVLMIAHSHLLGGMECHVVSLSKVMAEHGHQIYFAGPLDGWLGEQMQKAGYTCCQVPLNGMYDVFSWFKILRFVQRYNIDILHGHSQRGARYAAWCARTLSIAAVATAHSTDSYRWFKSTTHVIAVANVVKQFLLSVGLKNDRVHVVHSGVEDVLKPEWPQMEEISIQRPLKLGMIARVEHLKGHDIAFEALRLLKEKIPLEFVVVGDDQTEWGKHLREYVVPHLGLNEQVHFLGQRSDVPQLIQSFDLVLAPSRREALGLTLIEAAAAGRACIAANVGGISEIILHEKTGLLFPSEDSQAMAKAIERLVDPILRDQYGKAARQYYEAEFTMTAMQQKTENVYRTAIAESIKCIQ